MYAHPFFTIGPMGISAFAVVIKKEIKLRNVIETVIKIFMIYS
jgi:hypothetical protein